MGDSIHNPPQRTTPATGPAGVPSLEHLKEFYTVPGFKIGGTYTLGDTSEYEYGAREGTSLDSLGVAPLRTAYIAVGTPTRDESGCITNAVIISPYYSGDSAWCYYYWHEGQPGNDFSLGPVVGPGKLIDTDRFYVIYLDALGLWGASKPSEGLGMRFPEYSLFDAVQANYRLLKDKLKVARIRLATGVSMGAIQSYVWALLHPEMVEAIMPIGGITSAKKNTVLRWTFQLMSAAMMSDPVWRETRGDYYHLPKERHPNQGLKFGQSIVSLTRLDLDYRIEQGWDEVKKEVFAWDPQDGEGEMLELSSRTLDVNDLLARNRSQQGFDIDPYLGSINCPALVLHVENDLWLPVKLARESAAAIPGAKFASFTSPLAHFGVFRAPNVLREEINAFFRRIGLA